MKKGILSILLSGSLLASLVGCSSGGSSQSSSAAKDNGTNFKEQPYTLNISYPVYGNTPPDLPKIQDKVNDITLKEINEKVVFKPVSVTSMSNTYTLAASSGEKEDLIMLLPGGGYLTQYSQSKMIRPIDDEIKKYGKDIKAAYGGIFPSTTVQGKLYGIPSKDLAVGSKGLTLLDSIVKKYNIDVTKIKTIDDLDPIFAQVHASEPNLQIVDPIGVSAFLLNFDLGREGVLRNGGVDSLKVVDELKTPEYQHVIKKVREWYQKGYISKDFATTQSTPNDLLNANKLFCALGTTDFTNSVRGDNPAKDYVTLYKPVEQTGTYQMFIWAVPQIAQRPDKSIQFLNLVFKDQNLATLLKYGIEGEHYVKNSDGSIDTSKSGPSTFIMNWNLWGNVEKYPVTNKQLVGVGGDKAKFQSALEKWEKSTERSKAFGFMFDPDPVKTEIAACDAVYDQYQKLIEGGAIDPDKYIKIFDDKLYAAGLQKIIDEKQRQLNQWAKSQK